MEFKGSRAYDQQDFLENYLSRRSRLDSPNNAIEGPIVDGLLGSVENADVLDLGCGDGLYGKLLLAKGAKTYTGVEGSSAMLNRACEEIAGPQTKLVHTDMENFSYPDATYDAVISRMAIHYVEDLRQLFQSINKTMKKEAKFIFSVQHPITTSSFESKREGEKKGSWIVDDYFQQGIRREPWIGETIVKYHRSIETYFSALVSAGFQVIALQEGEPLQKNFTDNDEFKRRKRIPLVLVFSCRKIDFR